MLRMEPRARGVDYGPAVPAAASPAMDREMRLAHNKKCVAHLRREDHRKSGLLCALSGDRPCEHLHNVGQHTRAAWLATLGLKWCVPIDAVSLDEICWP